MATSKAAQDSRREQHPVTFNPNPPAASVAEALANSAKQVDKAKQK